MTILNTTNNYTYSNLTISTTYRAVVKSGGCAPVNSAPVSITVSPLSAGGTVSGANTVCSESNSGTLALSGHNGNIIRWQYSDDEGSSWTNISNTTPFHNYSNIDISTSYRAVIQNASCPTANSAEANIIVVPTSDGGTTSSNTTVCSGRRWSRTRSTRGSGSQHSRTQQWYFRAAAQETRHVRK